MTLSSRLRASVRLVLIALLSLVLIPPLYVIPSVSVHANSSDKRKRPHIGGLLANAWVWAVVKIIRLRINTVGEPPKAPFFLVSNHLGYLDAMVFSRVTPCVFVSAAEVQTWPLIGLLVRTSGAIFIDRDKPGDVHRVNHLVREALKAGRGVVVFPEGTSTNGADVLPFKSSLMQPALDACSQITFASLRYNTPNAEPPASEAVCFWDKEQKFEHHFFRLLSLSSIDATVVYGIYELDDKDRKQVARELTNLVRQAFEPMV